MSDKMHKDGSTPEPAQPKGKNWLYRFARFVGRTFVILMILLLLISLLIQTPEFQKYASDKASVYLSEKLDAEVDIKGFSLSFFDKLRLDSVLIQDKNQDTLLLAGGLTVDFRAPIFTLLRGRLELQNLILRDTRLRMKRGAHDDNYNLQRLFDKLNTDDSSSSEPKKESRLKLRVKLNNVFLQNVHFTQMDSLYGNSLDIFLTRGRMQIDILDLAKSKFHLKRLRLIEPRIAIDNFEPAIEKSENDTAGPIPIFVAIESLKLDGGKFTLQDHLTKPIDLPYQHMDYRHMDLREIHIDAEGVEFHDWKTVAKKVRNISATTSRGFVIESLQSDSVIVSPVMTSVEHARMKTSDSDINADIKFLYSSFQAWQNFEDEVSISIKSSDSRIYVQDVMNFAPGLYETQFFLDNMARHVKLDGQVDGQVNKLRGRQIHASINSMFIKGDMDITDATDPEKLYLKVVLTDSRFTAQEAEEILRGINLDEGFYRLGPTKVVGSFRGTLGKFKVTADIKTLLGSGNVNMALSMEDSPENAEYNGHVKLNNFDVGRFTGVDSIGSITLDMELTDGRGIPAESIDAFLTGKIDSFEIKRYVYKDIDIHGRASNERFIGTMSVKDAHIDANLEGGLYFKNLKKPSFDVDLHVDYLDLYALNLFKEPLTLSFNYSGKVDSFDLYGLNANSLLEDLEIHYRDSLELFLPSMYIVATSKAEGENSLNIESDIIDASIQGDYSWIKSFASFRNYFSQSFPQLSKRWGLKKDSVEYESKLAFDINLKNTHGFQVLFLDKLDTIKNLKVVGYINTEKKETNLNVHAPEILYNDNDFRNIYLTLFSGNGMGNIVFGVDSTIINNKISLSPVSIAGDLTYDTLTFNLNVANYNKEKDNFNIDGKVYPTEDAYALIFRDRYLEVLNNEWAMNSHNYIEFGEKYLFVDSLSIRYNDKYISLQSQTVNHLNLIVENIPLEIFNDNISDEALSLYGNLTMEVDLNDIYDLSQVKGNLNVDSFMVNDDTYGELTAEIIDDGTGRRSKVDIKAVHGKQQFHAYGYIHPQDMADFYNLDVKGKEIPFKMLEYLLYESISNTDGKVDAEVKVTGAIDQPEVLGKGRVYDAKTRLDILGVTYIVKDVNISISPTFIDFSGGKIYDKYGNVANIQGGLNHHNFRDFGASLTISTSRFLLLNTTKDINSFYFGHALGSAEVQITGPFTQPNIDIVAENAGNTEFNMSLFESEDIEDASFVRFESPEDDKDVDQSDNIMTPEGLNLKLNLTTNEKGKVKIFMDQDEENYIEGTGAGNIILDIKRTGDVSMFGTYNISSGTYRYSFNLIKRTFRVREGGYIQWTGDPLDARMHIVAEYSTYASPYSLLATYNVTRQEVSPTQAIVLINLNGPILRPDINFDIEIPDVQSNIRPYVDNALTSLRADQSKLDFQALSLITLGDFWPDEAPGSGVVYSGGANTLTGFLSSQVSQFLNSIINKAIRNVGFIDYIDLDFTMNYIANNEIDLENPESFEQLGMNEYRLTSKSFLFDERAILELGGNYVEGSAISSGAYVKGNVALEYILTDDRRLRIKLFTNTDQNIEGYQVKSGVGLRYQREFDSFGSIFDKAKSSIQRHNPLNKRANGEEEDGDHED